MNRSTRFLQDREPGAGAVVLRRAEAMQ